VLATVRTSPVHVLAKDPLKRKRGPKYAARKAARAAVRAAKRAAKSANIAARKAERLARAALARARRAPGPAQSVERARPPGGTKAKARARSGTEIGIGAGSRAGAGAARPTKRPRLEQLPAPATALAQPDFTPRGFDWHSTAAAFEHETETDSDPGPEPGLVGATLELGLPGGGRELGRGQARTRGNNAGLSHNDARRAEQSQLGDESQTPIVGDEEEELAFALDCLLSDEQLATLDAEMDALDGGHIDSGNDLRNILDDIIMEDMSTYCDGLVHHTT